jgi:hypothetical protein
MDERSFRISTLVENKKGKCLVRQRGTAPKRCILLQYDGTNWE